MRKFYPAAQVKEMATSIEAHKGVLEPLIVTKEDGKWLVIDGNMRLAGAMSLGAKCPELECKVVDQAKAQQLLSMVTTNQVRYDVDPLSEALHYRSLLDQGMSVRDISKKTGVYEVRIHNRLPLTRLEKQVQALVGEGKLSSDIRAAKALLRLTPAVQVRVAVRLASNPNTTIMTIIRACENLAGGKKPAKKRRHPGTQIAFGSPATPRGNAGDVRTAVAATCRSCTNYEALQGKSAEPAWSLVAHAANDTCDNCSLREVQNVCGQCPMVEMLRKLGAKGGK